MSPKEMATVVRRVKHLISGQGMVELALILPLVIVIIFGIMEFSYMMFRNATISNATREAARKAGFNRYTRTQIKGFVTSNATSVNIAADGIKITTSASDSNYPGNPPSVTVETSVAHQFIMGALFPVSSITLKSQQRAIIMTYAGGYENVTF